MSKKLQELMAKTQAIRPAKEYERDTQQPVAPRTAVGTMAAWQASQIRIAELEAQGPTITLQLAVIEKNPWQPRRVFEPDEIEKLAASIAELGLIQPIVVRRKDVSKVDTPPSVSNVDSLTSGSSVSKVDTSVRDVGVSKVDTFQLVAGERRYLAHQKLGLAEVKAVVIDATDEEMALMALAENVDRRDLTDYEISKALRNVQSQFETTKALAESVGIGRTDLYRFLEFSNLPDFVQADLEERPALLGRAAASEIVRKLKEHGERGIEALRGMWAQLKAGEIDQGKLAPGIEAGVKKGQPVNANRDIMKLFVGKEQAGSITRDAAALTVKIRAAALSQAKEDRLRSFVQELLQSAD